MNQPSNTLRGRHRAFPDEPYRARCNDCFRPVDLCYCDAITPVETRTDFLILQHRRERTHPFNSARIAARALTRCTVVCDRNEQLAQMELPIHSSAGLLYPSPNARLLNDVPKHELPEQLVVIDGTWHQAKTLYRDVEVLRALPCFALAPTTPGQYKIRLEPDATSLSTAEAIVAAVKQMEPENSDIARLLDGFHAMIDLQLAHPRANYGGETTQSQRAPNLNVPKSLLSGEHGQVVFYAEATPLEFTHTCQWSSMKQKRKRCPLPPVYVCAQRIDRRNPNVEACSENQFVRCIAPAAMLSPTHLRHMGLDESDFATAVSVEEFRDQWNAFLRVDDRLIAYHASSIGLLHNAKAQVPPFDLLHSINYDPERRFPDIESFLAGRGRTVQAPICKGRGGQRLASAVALTRYLSVSTT